MKATKMSNWLFNTPTSPNSSFAKFLRELFSGPQEPNYGHWIMA